MVIIEKIIKNYKVGTLDLNVLKGINLTIQDGKFIAIMGPSGSGKTTLLHILGGIDYPTSGRIIIDGENISELNDTKLTLYRRSHIGFVFQTFNLIPTLTVEKNIALPLLIAGKKKSQFKDKLENILTAPIFMFIGIGFSIDFFLVFILEIVKPFFSKIFGVSGMLAVEDLILRIKNTSITINAIIIGLSIAIGFMGMVNSMKYTATNWLDKTKWSDLLVFSVSGAEINESIIDHLGNYSFVVRINPLRYHFVPYVHEELSDNGFIFQGIQPRKFAEFVNLEIIEGNTEEVINKINTGEGILINNNLANMLKLKQGDVIHLQSKNKEISLRIQGTILDNSDFAHRLGKIVYGSFDLLKKYWNVEGYTVLQIHITNELSHEEAKEIIINDLATNYNIKILTHEEEKVEVAASLNRIFSIFYSINLIIFAIIFVIVFNTVLINIISQIIEFAILRSIGLFKSQVKIMIILEATIMGFIGILFSVLTGSWITNQFISGAKAMMGISFDFYFPFEPIILSAVLTIILSFIATIFPQRVALKKSISTILQESREM